MFLAILYPFVFSQRVMKHIKETLSSFDATTMTLKYPLTQTPTNMAYCKYHGYGMNTTYQHRVHCVWGDILWVYFPSTLKSMHKLLAIYHLIEYCTSIFVMRIT